MPYGTIKVDNITFTDNSVDKTVSLSGLIQNPTFTGNVTVTGTISGDVIRGGTTISGVTVTGTTANFVSGVFTTQISGATITGTTVATTTGSFVSLTGTTATFTSGIIASGTAALPSLAILSDPNTGIYSPGADQLAISTNGTEKLIVKSDGKVGIGTSSPGATLDVRGNAIFTGNATARQTADFTNTGGQLYTGVESSAGGAVFTSSSAYAGIVGTNNSTNLQLATNGAVRATLDTSGRLGIGTTSPSYKLHVVATSAAAARFAVNDDAAGISALAVTNDANADFEAVIYTSKVSLGSSVNIPICFHTNGKTNEKMRLDTSGRLLVGTSDGSGGVSKLVVQGASNGSAVGVAQISYNGLSSAVLAADTDIGYLRFTDQGSSSGVFAQITASTDGTTGASDHPGRLVFSTTPDGSSSPTSSPPAMTIKSSQEVLIGTSTITANGGILQLKSGITFPATAVAASDVNTLDDYEEGTWTAGIAFGGGTTGITYLGQTGVYTKIGRMVTCIGIVNLSSKGSSSGVAEITGLPFTVAAGEPNFSGVSFAYIAGMTFASVPYGRAYAGTTTVLLMEVTTAGVDTDITNADFSNTTVLRFSFTYFV